VTKSRESDEIYFVFYSFFLPKLYVKNNRSCGVWWRERRERERERERERGNTIMKYRKREREREREGI
jgi:hypothetical protein